MDASAPSGKKKINLYLLPLMFVIGILPFIVRIKEYNPQMQDTGFVGVTDKVIDIFLYYRHWVFVIIAGIMVILIILQCFLKKVPIRFAKLFIPLCGYALLAVLSALFSENRYFSLIGSYEQFSLYGHF